MAPRRHGSGFSSWRRIRRKRTSPGKAWRVCVPDTARAARLPHQSLRVSSMSRLILWAILLVLIVRSLSRLLHGVIEGAGYTREQAPPRSVGLVRDPVCGVFVVPGH